MAQFIAYNSALSAASAIDPGTSYVTGTARVALQLAIPSAGQIELVEWGVSLATVQATATALEVCSTATATGSLTTHTTTTIQNILDPNGATSRLTMGAAATGFGNTGIASNTSLRPVDRQNVFSSYAKIWPLGSYPKFGATGAAQYLQFRISTAATVNAYLYAVFNELI
jgi:hypothetical protein